MERFKTVQPKNGKSRFPHYRYRGQCTDAWRDRGISDPTIKLRSPQ
jgi:hypothetical protein